MPSAKWNGEIIATATDEECVIVEGNTYFPADKIDRRFFEESDHHTTCPWKGVASYLHVVVSGSRNDNAAWFYPDPKPRAAHIKGHVAFWRGVEVED